MCTPNPKVTLKAPHPQHSHPPAPRPRSWSGGTASTVCPTQPPTHPPPALCTHPHRALHGQHGHALPAQPGAKHTNRSGPDPSLPCRASLHCLLSSSSTRESRRASVVSNSSWVSAAREGQGRSRTAGGWKLRSKVHAFPCRMSWLRQGGSQRVDRGEEQLEHPQFTCPEVEAELSSAFPCLDWVTESQNGLGSEEP